MNQEFFSLCILSEMFTTSPGSKASTNSPKQLSATDFQTPTPDSSAASKPLCTNQPTSPQNRPRNHPSCTFKTSSVASRSRKWTRQKPIIQNLVFKHCRESPRPRSIASRGKIDRHLPVHILHMKDRSPGLDERLISITLVVNRAALVDIPLHQMHHRRSDSRAIFKPDGKPVRMCFARQEFHVADRVLFGEREASIIIGVTVDIIRIDAITALVGGHLDPRSHHIPHTCRANIKPFLARPCRQAGSHGGVSKGLRIRPPVLVRPSGEIANHLRVHRMQRHNRAMIIIKEIDIVIMRRGGHPRQRPVQLDLPRVLNCGFPDRGCLRRCRLCFLALHQADGETDGQSDGGDESAADEDLFARREAHPDGQTKESSAFGRATLAAVAAVAGAAFAGVVGGGETQTMMILAAVVQGDGRFGRGRETSVEDAAGAGTVIHLVLSITVSRKSLASSTTHKGIARWR